MSIYRGFNTVDRDYGPYHLKDNVLVIRDLLNHLNIRKGEKLMNPSFGTIIWQSMFEPLTPALRAAITDDINNLVAYDPRIKQLNRVVIEDWDGGMGITLKIDITFAATNELANLTLRFNNHDQRITLI